MRIKIDFDACTHMHMLSMASVEAEFGICRKKKRTRDNKVHLMTLCTTVMGERFMITHKRLYSFYHDWLVKIDWTRHDRAICRQMTTSTITIRRFYTTEIQNAILRDRSSKLADLFLDIWPIYLSIVSMIKVLECQTRGSGNKSRKKRTLPKKKGMEGLYDSDMMSS